MSIRAHRLKKTIKNVHYTTKELSDFLKGTGRDPRRYDK